MKNLKFLSLGILLFLNTNIFAKEIPFTLEDRDRLIKIETKLNEIDKRFEQIDKRFEQIDKRFEQMQTTIWMLIVVFIGITGVTIGFALWDRRTMIRPFETKVKQIDERIQIQEIEIGKVQKLILALRELANVDGKVKDVLAKFNLL